MKPDDERVMYRKLVRILTENFTKEELETIYVQQAESAAAVAQALMSRSLLDKAEKSGYTYIKGE